MVPAHVFCGQLLILPDFEGVGAGEKAMAAAGPDVPGNGGGYGGGLED